MPDMRQMHINKYAKVAVMGCAVNGPGEAKEVDIGLAYGETNAVLFEKGKIISSVDQKEAVSILLKKLDDILEK